MDKEHGKFDWPKQAVLVLIKLWKANECLYNSKHKFYNNIHARYEALNQMAAALKILNPAIGAAEVRTKIQSLRGQYSRELAKATEKNIGADAVEPYIPTAYWYYELSFLNDYLKTRKGGCNLSDENSVRTDDTLDSSMLDCETFSTQPSKSSRSSSEMQQVSPTMSQEDSALLAAASVLDNVATSKKNNIDKVVTFCNYMQSELNEISNVDMRDDLMENITMVIFEAKKKVKISKEREYDFNSFDN